MLTIGSWVKGKSMNGEFVLGYIESLNTSNGTVKIKVVQSDHDKIVGKKIETLSRLVQYMPASEPNEKDIRELIELAIITKDKEWFLELQEKFKMLQKDVRENKQDIMTSSSHNRLGSLK